MIVVIFYVLIFIAGLFIGSFLNVVSDRIVKGKNVFFGRSECDYCERSLKAIDLVPLLSFISTKGKCRYCGEKLSLYYPLSEVLTGFSFVGSAYFINLFSNTQSSLIWILYIYFLGVFSFYIIIFLADVKYRIIPNKVVYPAIIFVIFFLLFNFAFTVVSSYRSMKNDPFGKYLLESGYWNDQMLLMAKGVGYTFLSALAIGVFFWLLTKIKDGRAMGGGDVKLAFLIGLFNGFPFSVLAIFLGFLLGAVFSISLVFLRRKTIKDTVPFGPFLILGSVVSLVWGPVILSWYFGLF